LSNKSGSIKERPKRSTITHCMPEVPMHKLGNWLIDRGSVAKNSLCVKVDRLWRKTRQDARACVCMCMCVWNYRRGRVCGRRWGELSTRLCQCCRLVQVLMSWRISTRRRHAMSRSMNQSIKKFLMWLK